MQVFETDFGGRKFSITTDYVAKQAAGSAWVRYGDTVILATVCVGNRISEGFGGGDCLPLTVDYRERTYAAGKIPGGFFKREGKPREREVLFSRLTDRTIRPLFPSNFKRDIQVACSLLSADLVNDSDVMLIIGASVASMLSGVPFAGPVAAVRIGVLNGEYIVNPSMEQTDKLELDIIVSGTKDSVMMIEGGAAEASEEVVSKVFELAQQEINRMVEFQKQIVGNVVVKEYPEMQPNPEYQEFENKAKLVINPLLDDFLKQSVTDKKEFSEKLNTVKTTSAGQIVLDTPEKIKAFDVVFFEEYHKKARKKIIDTRVRLDGRKPDELRNITCAIGVLPRTHGSALFTRGNTQALATVTLGTPDDMQIMDELAGEYKEHFLLHYNFPSFSVGETRPERGPGRREIGHGALARRGLEAVMPDKEKFAYTIRIVSDILESNGSSSMASVCGGTLALMDAGVPIKSTVAGISIGLVYEEGKYVLLTDIQGEEDHAGDMDFKVAGTRKGVTAIQMDLKTPGVALSLLKEALEQAKSGRFAIMDIMEQTIGQSKKELSTYAPRMVQVKVPVNKIREVIGPGGKIINKIQDETGATISIEDDGTTSISAPNGESLKAAKEWVEGIIAEVEIGKIYTGKVTRVENFGAFVEVLPGKEGLVHISQIAQHRVQNVTDEVNLGDTIKVKAMEIDSKGRLNLSRKAAMGE